MDQNQNDLKQYEFENDIQRFMQIRDQVHEEIKKIGAHVTTLADTNKRLVAHFDVFEKISKKTEDQIYAAIKAAAHDMSRESVRLFSPIIEELLRKQILQLDQSVKAAERTLCAAMEEKNRKPFYYSLLWWLFLATAGFGIGSIVSRQNTPILPDRLIQKIDVLGQRMEVLSKKNIQEKKKREKE